MGLFSSKYFHKWIYSCFKVDFKPLPRFWFRSIQVVPDPIKPFIIFRFLSPNSPNIHRINIHGIVNPINPSLCLIKNLPIDSSPYLYKENNMFYKKSFYNLVFGDDFDFNGIRRMYHDLFSISGTKWYPPLLWQTRERSFKSRWRIKSCGHLLIPSSGLIRKLPSNWILCTIWSEF